MGKVSLWPLMRVCSHTKLRFVRNIIIPVTHNIIRITEAVHLIRMYGYLVCVIPPALGYMQIVSSRDANTLLPIIQQHVENGTIIWSHSWSSYRQVAQLPPVQQHECVNHSIEFVSSQWVHTNHIESYWNRCKVKLKRMRGCHRDQMPSYLDEFLWRERYGSNYTLENIYRDIALWYPV